CQGFGCINLRQIGTNSASAERKQSDRTALEGERALDSQGMPQAARPVRRTRITKAESEREAKRQEYLLELDTPTQALKPGGANELASVAGVPGRPEKPGQGLQLWAKGVLFAEPIAVVMRDAVTPETAERLLGVDRRSLARSIHA